MIDTDDLRELAAMVPEGWAELCKDAADEIDKMRQALDQLRLIASDIFFMADEPLEGMVPKRPRRKRLSQG